MSQTIESLKPLTTEQYDRAREATLKRVEKRVGERPERKQFNRELARLWTILDVIAGIVFIAALVVSSTHIIVHMGLLADASYQANQASGGTVIGHDVFVSLHQWMLIPLAEGSMLLFVVMYGLTRDNWRRWVYLILAILAVVFVLVANWQSGIGLLESMLPPAFTIGIGLKLEHLVIQSLKRRAEVDKRYTEALEIWEAAHQDATKHPDYTSLLKQEIWQALMKLKANAAFIEAPTPFKLAAVRREMERDTWAQYEGQVVTSFEGEGEVGTPVASVPFGNSPITPDGPKSMPMIAHVNGRGGAKITET